MLAAHAQAQTAVRPYASTSPWNLRIGNNPVYSTSGASKIAAMQGVFGSKVTKYTMPVYEISSQTPKVPITISGRFTTVYENGKRVSIAKKGTVRAPLPPSAQPAAGRDSQIILWNPATGDEWGFWRVKREGSAVSATNGYYYNTRWSGVPPHGFFNRGAGLPYLAGLIRPWEIEQGHIDHAIAFGVNYPSTMFIHPATKSDGKDGVHNMPAGARLQLDPNLTDADFDRWGLSIAARIIAKALQEYGMILVDSSGHPKIYAEYEGTARWNGLIHDDTVRNIPYSAFRMLSEEAPIQPDTPQQVHISHDMKGARLKWQPSRWATRYRVYQNTGDGRWECIALWVEETYLQLQMPQADTQYVVVAVNHNGLSRPSAIAVHK